MRLLPAFLVTAIAVLAAAPATASVVFTLTPIVVEGDSAGSVGRVTSIDNLAVNNSGTWLVEADTDFAGTDQDAVLLRNDVVYLREDDALPRPPGARLNTFDSVNLDNTGGSSWNFFLAGTSGTNDDSGVYRNTNLLIQESNISTSPSFSPGTPYIGFFDVKTNSSNRALVVASIDDPAIATTVDRALVILDTTGDSLVSETVLAKEADLLPGQTETVADFGTGPHQSAINDNGDVLYFADLNGSTTTDGCIYRNLTLLAQEGSPSPVGGRNYELLSSRGLDINNNGDYVFKANLDGATTDDEMIVKNGSVFIREGDTLPAITGYLFTSFGITSGPVVMDDAGNVVWFGDWDHPDTTKDTALFWNDQVIISEGETINGMVLDEISNGDDAFAISDNGRWILFEGLFAGGISAAILVEVDATVPVVEAVLHAAVEDGGVALDWNVTEVDAVDAVTIARAVDGAAPTVVAAWTGAEAARQGRWIDREVEAGVRYAYRLTVHYGDAVATSEEIEIVAGQAPRPTALLANVPNPFNPSTRLRFRLERAGDARLGLFDARGRQVRSFEITGLAAGEHEVVWDGRDDAGGVQASGVYYLRLTAGTQTFERPITLVR